MAESPKQPSVVASSNDCTELDWAALAELIQALDRTGYRHIEIQAGRLRVVLDGRDRLTGYDPALYQEPGALAQPGEAESENATAAGEEPDALAQPDEAGSENAAAAGEEPGALARLDEAGSENAAAAGEEPGALARPDEAGSENATAAGEEPGVLARPDEAGSENAAAAGEEPGALARPDEAGSENAGTIAGENTNQGEGTAAQHVDSTATEITGPVWIRAPMPGMVLAEPIYYSDADASIDDGTVIAVIVAGTARASVTVHGGPVAITARYIEDGELVEYGEIIARVEQIPGRD